jgi:hypothetical protein
MANALFDSARNSFLTGTLSWTSGTYKVALLNSGYTFSAAHTLLQDVDGGGGAPNVVATATLAGEAAVGGVADATDLTFTAVTGSQVTSIVIYKFVTDRTDSPVVAFINVGTNLPITPNGGDITIAWDNGANKIFKL